MKLEEPIWFDTPPKDKGGAGGAKSRRTSSGGSGGGGGRSSQVLFCRWWECHGHAAWVDGEVEEGRQGDDDPYVWESHCTQNF